MLRLSTQNLWMFKAFVIANIVDAISSIKAISMGGGEANPLLSIGFETVGLELTLVLKVVAAFLIGLILVNTGRGHLLKWPTLVITLIAVSNSLQVMFY